MKPRLRSYGLAAIGTTMIGLAIVALAPSAALATRSPASGLRYSLGQLVTALRETASPTVCSLATPAGQATLIEIVSEDAPTPPGTTCQDAFAGLPKKLSEEGGQGSGFLRISIPDMIRTASLRINGNRATARLTRDDWVTGRNGTHVTGAAAVKLDPLGLSHWIRNRQGRWMFNDQPTGPYSSAGRRAATLISNALKGSTLRIPPPVEVTYGLCHDQATTNDTITVGTTPTDYFPAGQGGSWFVAGGYSTIALGGSFVGYPQANGLDPQEAPFDAQGNPQGSLWLSPPPFSAQFDVKLVGGKVIALGRNEQEVVVERTVTPGTAGC